MRDISPKLLTSNLVSGGAHLILENLKMIQTPTRRVFELSVAQK